MGYGELRGQVDSFTVGKIDIEQDPVWRLRHDGDPGLLHAPGLTDHLVTAQRQELSRDQPEAEVVVDDQHTSRHANRLAVNHWPGKCGQLNDPARAFCSGDANT
jgi:hypothetical protein